MVGQQVRQDVVAVEQQAPDPGQVVQPDLVDEHALGLDPEHARGGALDADRDVAQADGAVTRVEQAAGDDPDRVGEVDDPGVLGGQLAHALGDLEHDGDGAQRLAEPAGAGRLLADAAAGERDRLVGEAGLLAADAELDQDERSALERAVEVVGDRQRSLEAGGVEHPRGEAAHDLAPLRVDVLQDDVCQVEPLALARETRDQLRRVGRAAADDGELHRRRAAAAAWVRESC